MILLVLTLTVTTATRILPELVVPLAASRLYVAKVAAIATLLANA